jgi:hypothetical protein
MNSLIASSVKRGCLQRTLHGNDIGARPDIFNNMLTEFSRQEKRMPIRDKGLFLQDKFAGRGCGRDKMLNFVGIASGIFRSSQGAQK